MRNPVFDLTRQAEAGLVIGGIGRPAEKSTMPAVTMTGLLAGGGPGEKPPHSSIAPGTGLYARKLV
jgi:hypothetical protein